MPDGRKAADPVRPGRKPRYGAEQNGLLAS